LARGEYLVDELVRYADEHLKKGYSPAQIKESLIRNGYSPAIVEGVLESVMRKNQSQVSAQQTQFQPTRQGNSLVPKLIGVTLFVALLIAAAVIAPLLLAPKQALLDVNSIPDKESYKPGEEVAFDVEISNMGSKERFDVTLIYRVLDLQDNLITHKEETIAISTSTSFHKAVKLPSNIKVGSYTLKVFANYDKKVATSSFLFKVESIGNQAAPVGNTQNNQVPINPVSNTTTPVDSTNNPAPKKETCSDEIRNQNEVGIDCGGACGGYWYDLSCHSNPKSVVAPSTQSGSSTKSIGAQLMEIRLLAKTDSQEAIQQCSDFADEQVRDSCIKSVAQASLTSNYCELVINDNERDTCYYPFFMQGDYSVCDKLVLKDSLQTCAQLKQISQLSQSSQTNPPENAE
jgi:hypothetical protein